MKKINRILILSFLLLFVFQSNSCKKDKKVAPGPVFSVGDFETELKASLGSSGAIGWTYIIIQNGFYSKGGAFGKCRNNADVSKTMTLDRKINIASITKFITAIAAMQLLERRGLNPATAKISSWLPPSWSQGPGVNNLTFGDLLNHTSGLSSSNTQFSQTLSYTGLRLMVDTGVILNNNYRYLNANFALFRILIPSLWKGLDDAPVIGTLDSATTSAVYEQYIQEKVFAPIGVTAGLTAETRSKSTLYYATTDLETGAGAYYGDWHGMAGGGGFFMTTMELASVVAYYRHTELIISNAYRKIMEDNRYGFELKDDTREVHGNYFPKNGSIGNTAGQGTLEQIVCFPNGVEVVVMFNTQGMVFAGGQTNLRIAIYDAYNKAWK